MTAVLNDMPPTIVGHAMNPGAKTTCCFELARRRRIRCVNRGGDAEIVCRPRQSQAGIAGTGRVRAVIQVTCARGQHRIAHRSNLEDANGLQVFELEEISLSPS